MSMKKKKKKKERGPEYYTSLINTQALNYKEYYLSIKEKLVYSLIAFAAGAAAAYLFYGGLGKDSYGQPTVLTYILDCAIMLLTGSVCVIKFLPMISRNLQKKRQMKLIRQFMDLLDSLATSIASGNNAPNAFIAAKNDLLVQYSENADIVKELDLIIAGMANNIPIPNMLSDFGKRSGIDEISSFAQVFDLSYGRGGDFGRIIRESYELLYSKNEIRLEIETKVSATKNELNMMMAMPFLLIAMIKFTGGDFADNFSTPSGVIATTVGLILFIAAYKIGSVITDIEV